MFVVKEYDLGQKIERVGYYSDVLEKKPLVIGSNKVKKVIPEEVKRKINHDNAVRRAKTKIRRLATRHNLRYLWTLTFAEKEVITYNRVKNKKKVYDAGNYDDVWRLWKSFLDRCRKKGLEFDYIATLEVQEKRQEKYNEKVYHIHFITNKNIPIDAKNARKQGKKIHMQMLWTHGYSFVSKHKSKKNLASFYVAKYISKLIDELGVGRQRYRVKEGMTVPVREFALKDHIEFYELVQNIHVYATTSYNVYGEIEIFWQLFDIGNERRKKV